MGMATAKELRELKLEELEGRVKEIKRSLFDMKSKHNTGVLDSTADLGKARKDAARCLTVKREKELAADAALAAAAAAAPGKPGTGQAARAADAAAKGKE
jgi:large subunit ribosomal protein L29